MDVVSILQRLDEGDHKRVLVVAGTYAQAREWAQRQGLDTTQWIFVSTLFQLRGHPIGTPIVFVGEFWRSLAVETEAHRLIVAGWLTKWETA